MSKNTVKKPEASHTRLEAIRAALSRGFQEPIEEDIVEGQISMMALLFPVFNPEEEVQS